MKVCWKCPYCKEQLESFTQQRWTMNTCKCEKSAVDAEEGYIRIIGDAKIIQLMCDCGNLISTEHEERDGVCKECL